MNQFGVFGLGEFGLSICKTLSNNHCEVLAVDHNEDIINNISAYATMAVCADLNDVEVIKSFELDKLDCVIVCCGDKIGTNVLLINAAREAGVKKILVKANNETFASIYKLVGATDIVFPETQMGERIGKRLSNESILDMIPLADDTNIVEMHTPKSWIGKNIIDLKARSRFGINIIGFKINGKLTTNFDPKQELKETDIILVIGKEEDINKVNR